MTGPAAQPGDPPRRWTLEACSHLSQIVMTLITILGSAFVVYQLVQAQTSMATAAQATVYQAGNAITQLVLEHPELREILYREDEDEPPEVRDQRLRKLLETPEIRQPVERPSSLEKQRIRTAIEFVADSFDQMYWLRDLLPADDWNAWWSYFQDVYDDCPLLRDLYTRRPDWYTVDDFLGIADKAARKKALQR